MKFSFYCAEAQYIRARVHNSEKEEKMYLRGKLNMLLTVMERDAEISGEALKEFVHQNTDLLKYLGDWKSAETIDIRSAAYDSIQPYIHPVRVVDGKTLYKSSSDEYYYLMNHGMYL